MDGRTERVDQAVHEGHDVAEIGDVDQRDSKLVAAEPRDQVAVPQARLDAGADLAQHRVASAVLGGIVDFLELVDVEEDHRDMACLRAACAPWRRPASLQMPCGYAGR